MTKIDRLQETAYNFAREFGLNPVVIEFTEAFDATDIKVFDFLARPDKKLGDLPGAKALFRQLEMLPAEAEQARAAAKHDFLWKEYPKKEKAGAIRAIEEENVRILQNAIEICGGRKPIFKTEQEREEAQAAADKIKEFHHLEKYVTKEIMELIELLTKEQGKMPVFEIGPRDFPIFVHEVVHNVLIANSIYVPTSVIDKWPFRFNEGLTSYLHMRFDRSIWMQLSFYSMGNPGYMKWSKFFATEFARVLSRQIGPLLKRNLRTYYANFISS